jgi:hypothetical protein
MDWRYVLRVRKHLLRYKPVLFSVSLNQYYLRLKAASVSVSASSGGGDYG